MKNLCITCLCCILQLILRTSSSYGQFNFTNSNLQNASIANPTSLQFGPDNKLYVAQQDGTIKIFTIVKDSPGSYRTTSTETILLVKQIPNHYDNGTPKPYNKNTNKRQVTGLCVAGTAGNPIIYVNSSDNDIGAGSNGDKNLCTNSGVISKLTKSGSSWIKVDLVRGLPRSEENHATNGLAFDATHNKLYVTSAGFTNSGSPSRLFTYISEYALAACILQVDLASIEAMPLKNDETGAHPYKYDLPTLDDPSRTNKPDGTDLNDPWGGNDGLNQAKIINGGPVSVYASGFRNPYDVIISRYAGNGGKIYTIDNGANQNWGGHPDKEGTANVTNNYVAGEPGSSSPGPNDPMVNNLDGFHFIGDIITSAPGSYYGGHPCPVRANPGGAGLYTHDGPLDSGSAIWRTSKNHSSHPLPSDWPPVPLNMANPVEGDFQNPGETNKALLTFNTSTNGLCEYTASNFNNALKGNILAVSFDGNIHRIRLSAAGNEVLNQKGNKKLNQDAPFASGFGSKPLDIIAQGDDQIFPGSIWVAVYASNAIAVFEPAGINCSGTYSSLDEDGDKYINSDEIDNGTNPCSAASKPNDNDQDFISDLKDPDDDNDGIPDTTDPFQLDDQNGLSKNIPFNHSMFNNDPGYGFFGLGFTGIMTNGQTDYLNAFDESHLIAGGAIGALTIDAVTAGDALGSANNQQYAFQFGVNVNSSTAPFIIQTKMLGSFFNNLAPKNFQSQGIYLGTGDQDNYLKIALNANGGSWGIQVVTENAGSASSQQYSLSSPPSSTVDLFLHVNPSNGSVQPKYSVNGGAVISIGNSIHLSGALLSCVQGSKAVAVGIISTSRGSNTPFNATWDFISLQYEQVVAQGNWSLVPSTDGSNPTHRHENAYVQAGDKFYLIGGRGTKPVQIYDPVNKTWKNGMTPPVNMHHFQAVEYKGLIYVMGAFTGNYPDETPLANIYIYDPKDNKWFVGPQIPPGRRRGSAGVIVYNEKIYMIGGIINGHNSGFVSWFDEYDPGKNTWKILEDAPHARDHFHAALIGGKMYLAGGRNTSLATGKLFNLTIPQVDMYDFPLSQWSTLSATIPTQRAGAATVALGNEIIVIGGESMARLKAHPETEALNVTTHSWRKLDTMNFGRHGTQAVVSNGGIYIACGNGNRGGGAELNNQEIFFFGNPSPPAISQITKSKLAGPDEVTFGTTAAGNSQTQNIILNNTEGNQAVLINAISIANNVSNLFSFNFPYPLPVLLNPGKAITIPVTYTAGSSPSTNASLVVQHSGQGGSSSITLINGNNNPGTSGPLFFVNAGGNTVPDSRMQWGADTQGNPSAYSNYAQTFNKTTTQNFTGVNTTDAPSEIFSSYRWDGGIPGDPLSKEMRWTFPVPSGDYTVHLYFVENWSGATSTGKRVFDVTAEGNVVLNDFDIYAESGFNRAVKKTFNISVSDGNLNIDFIHIIQNPRVNGIAIYSNKVPEVRSLSYQPGAVNFPSTQVQSIREASISLENTGNVSLTISSITITGENPGDFINTITSPFTLSPGENSSIKVQFKPASPGTKNSRLTIVHSGENSPVIISLSGEGTSSPPNGNDHPVVLYRINSGGYELPSGDSAAVKWALDNYPSPSNFSNVFEAGNKVFATSDAITVDPTVPAGTPKAIFQSERSVSNANTDMLAWEFPVSPGGEVEVRLYFSEIYFNAAGLRLFDIEIEDSVQLKNYDIYAEAGHDVGTMKSFTATSDGSININLVRVKQNPKISGIELICLNNRCNSNNLRFASGTNKISANAYPNPFQHEVRVKLSDPDGVNGKTLKIQLFNSMGGVMEESEMEMHHDAEFLEFNLSHLPVGIYFLHIQSEFNGVNETFKLIKQ